MADPIVSSQLSVTELKARVDDYGDCIEEDSLPRGKIYLKAARMLHNHLLTSTEQDGQSADFDVVGFREEFKSIKRWFHNRRNRQSAPAHQFYDVSDFRERC